MDLNFVYKSSDHLRFENRITVSGPYGGEEEIITKIRSNINFPELSEWELGVSLK